MDGWTLTGPAAGSGPNVNDFARIPGGQFPEGAVVATPVSLWMGFGFEGITDAATRADVLQRALGYLP
jgi:hypothetical protein